MTRVTQAEFARLAGVNRSTVHRWIQNGRIEADAHGLIDPDAAARMRDATESPMPHHQARKAQFDEAREGIGQGGAEKTQQAGQEAQQPATPEPMPAMEKLGAALMHVVEQAYQQGLADAAAVPAAVFVPINDLDFQVAA